MKKAIGFTGKGLGVLAFAVLCLICLVPFVLLPLMGSYSTEELMQKLPFSFGDHFFENTRTLLKSNFLRVYLNSVLVTVGSIVLSVSISVLAAYSIAKFQYRGAKLFNTLIVVTMMVPGQISTIGYIMEMRAMGMTNSLWPLIFTWMAHPFTCFFLIQFMKNSVPTEVIESGRIDGASEPRILFSLVLPFIRPGVATTVIMLFLWSWNNYTLPMLMINDNEMFTIPLYVANLISEFRFDIGGRMAALTWAVFPVIILFAVFSKSFIAGISAGSVKG